MVPIGFSITSTNMIGRFLGAQKPDTAKSVAKLALLTICIWEVIYAIVLFFCRGMIPKLFSYKEKEIA